MRQLIDDTLDLVRLRFKPLEEYQYPFWQPALVLTLLGVVSAAGAENFTGDTGERILFFVALNWLETTLFVAFIGWWLRLAKWKQSGSLFGIAVLANAPQFLEPLASWLPEGAATVAAFVIALYCVMILLQALAAVSGVNRLRIMLGVVLFAPLAMLTLSFMLSLAISNGWMEMPEDVRQSIETAGNPADTQP